MLANVDGAEASIARPREQVLLLERYRHDGQEQAGRQETPGDTPCVEKKKNRNKSFSRRQFLCAFHATSRGYPPERSAFYFSRQPAKVRSSIISCQPRVPLAARHTNGKMVTLTVLVSNEEKKQASRRENKKGGGEGGEQTNRQTDPIHQLLGSFSKARNILNLQALLVPAPRSSAFSQ